MFLPKAKSPCAIPKSYTFLGPCKAGVVTSKGGSYALPKYQGTTFEATLGRNNAKGSVPFVFGEAVTMADIKGTDDGKSFPEYDIKNCEKNGSCPGKAAVYVLIDNKGKSVIDFSTDTTIVVTDSKFPGTTCFPGILSDGKWNSYSKVVSAKVKAGKITITIPPNPLFTIAVGVGFLTIACS
jgi:hypothetical protein